MHDIAEPMYSGEVYELVVYVKKVDDGGNVLDDSSMFNDDLYWYIGYDSNGNLIEAQHANYISFGSTHASMITTTLPAAPGEGTVEWDILPDYNYPGDTQINNAGFDTVNNNTNTDDIVYYTQVKIPTGLKDINGNDGNNVLILQTDAYTTAAIHHVSLKRVDTTLARASSGNTAQFHNDPNIAQEGFYMTDWMSGLGLNL